MKREMSPCCVCTRVADPEGCTDKTCRVWQAWFLRKWEQSRMEILQMKQAPAKNAGVALGGRRYAAPHEVRAYLRTDPCGSCRVPGGICTAPCRKRLVWEDIQ